MADFKEAYKITAGNEGGWVNNPKDPGGETYRGISRKNFPSWIGWKFIDAFKDDGIVKTGFINPDLDKLAAGFYKTNFWDKLSLDKIKSQPIANQVFDEAVIGGAGKRLVGMITKSLKKVGISGPVENINLADEHNFFNAFKDLRTKRYLYAGGKLDVNDPDYVFFSSFGAPPVNGSTFLNGWLARVNKFDIVGAAEGAGLLLAAVLFFLIQTRKHKSS